MRMSDVFDLPVTNKRIDTVRNPPVPLMDACAHAINCHDDLVAALLGVQTYLFDEAEKRDYDPPIPAHIVGLMAVVLEKAMGRKDLAAHVDAQRAALAKARGEGRSMPKIKEVWLPEPMRDGEYPEGAIVGRDGVTEIIERDEYQGDHSIKWFDVLAGDKLVKKFGGRHVASVYYSKEG